MKKLLIFTLLLGTLNANAQDLDFTKMIQPVPQTAKFEDNGYMVWCGSMVKGDDGKYYLFYSRWPQSKKHLAWVTDSEVAVAVAKLVQLLILLVAVTLKLKDPPLELLNVARLVVLVNAPPELPQAYPPRPGVAVKLIV